jgi:hypothetical protein
MHKRFVIIFAIFLALFVSHTIPCAENVMPATQAQSVAPQIIGIGAQRAPSIDIDRNDTLYLMMSGATKPASEHTPGSQVFFTQSVNYGASWDNFPLTRNLSNSKGEAFGPALFVTKVGKPKIYATYHDDVKGPTQAYLLRTKKGVKFKAPIDITPHSGGAFTPRIAVDSAEMLNIVWGDTDTPLGRRVIFTRSTDLGFTFTEPVDISRSPGKAFEPEIAVDPNDGVNVVWEDDRDGAKAIMFTRSSDGGATFSTPLKISQGTSAAAESHIAIDKSGRVYVSWIQEIDGTLQVFFARSTDNGITFSTPIQLTNDNNAEMHKVFVTTFKNVVYVAFNNDYDRDRQAYVMRSTDAGISFGQPVQFSNATRTRGRAHSVSMVVDSRGVLHVVWADSSIIGDNQDESLVLYSKSNDGGPFSTAIMIPAYINLP